MSPFVAMAGEVIARMVAHHRERKRKRLERRHRRKGVPMFKVTPGMETSEFRLTLLTVIGSFVMKYLGADFPLEAFGTVAAYVISRGLAKVRKP